MDAALELWGVDLAEHSLDRSVRPRTVIGPRHRGLPDSVCTHSSGKRRLNAIPPPALVARLRGGRGVGLGVVAPTMREAVSRHP